MVLIYVYLHIWYRGSLAGYVFIQKVILISSMNPSQERAFILHGDNYPFL